MSRNYATKGMMIEAPATKHRKNDPTLLIQVFGLPRVLVSFRFKSVLKNSPTVISHEMRAMISIGRTTNIPTSIRLRTSYLPDTSVK